MKNILFLVSFFYTFHSIGQESKIVGAYRSQANEVNKLVLITTDYISVISYKDGVYLSTFGGPYQFDGRDINITLEYIDAYPDSVGLQKIISVQSLDKDQLWMEGLQLEKAIHTKQDLDGLWRITGRQSNETMSNITKGDRKTIKLLVDGYFQWIAINPAEKGFYGTGGGKYTFNNGEYKEQILFFSRDNSRVGQTLTFDGALREKLWHHSGKSSKGAPIYEIWSPE